MTAALAFLALAGATVPEPVAVRGDEMVAVPAPHSEIRTVDLRWSGKVHIELESAPNELVVRFDRPLDEAAIKSFVVEAGPDLADLRWNDTNLVLRAVAGRRMEALADDHSLRVRFLPDEDASVPSAGTPGERDAAIELTVVRAQADAAAGYSGQARRRLAVLAERYPDDRQVQRALADAEVADGAIATAAARYRTIAADDSSARRVIAEASGNITSGLTIRSGKTFSQTEANLNGSVAAGPGLTVGGGVRYVISHADIVAGPAGELRDVDSKSTIADLVAGVSVGSAARLVLQASALFGKDVAGGGARLFVGSIERQARLILAYRLPDLSTAEQSEFGGHIGRIGIGGTLRLTPELVVQGDLAWNGYGLADFGIRSRTVSATGGLDYLLRRRSPSLALSYRLDAEYVDWARMRANGLAFIPLSDRENHSVQLVSSLSYANVQLTGAVGWTKDRLGGGGPTANLSAVSRLGDLWRIEANGGVSSVSRPGISGRQLYLRLLLSRYLGRL